ncbi:hypothetical protein BMF94_3782 [Rhodotorula taiwanensis]|uniref:Stress-response A/B barrel domain-containing protein n=1 Tax=Rhodotorula taiwanensis TaxID=741276 RepID=A0A2S5B8Q0_9BASI|nr:hypothetical protein BMF94_3782 [Rhodotorula taiwanensis]
MPSIVHIVSLKYKSTTSDAEKHLVGSSFLALQDKCQHPSTGEKYLTVIGGRNNSPEGFEKGFEHAFVVNFASEEDRAYYLDQCPVHGDFKKLAGQYAEDVFVIDFVPGNF